MNCRETPGLSLWRDRFEKIKRHEGFLDLSLLGNIYSN